MYMFVLLSDKRHHIPSIFWICCCTHNKLCHLMVIYTMFKETKSATMNIFLIFYLLFKSFVKVDLSYAFTINMFTIAENCTEK